MKNTLKLVGLFVLIGFSFFYTDKVIDVIREEDKIMIELNQVKDSYKLDGIDASIVLNTIIPGVNGRVVNVDKSYKEMKNIGMFNKNSLVYDVVRPSISVVDNKDKYIIKGNSNKRMVSIVFIVSNDMYLERLNELSINKGVVFNYFLDYEFLINNTTLVKKISNSEFYSYGNVGKYTPDNLLFSNNLISRISDNEAVYCLNTKMDDDMLKLCSDNELYTITPSIQARDNLYNEVKKQLESGSIILVNLSSDNVSSMEVVIDYIKGKGLEIEGLSKMLSE